MALVSNVIINVLYLSDTTFRKLLEGQRHEENCIVKKQHIEI